MRTEKYIDEKNIQLKTKQWLAAIKAETAPKEHLNLSPADCALLVVDMVNYFCTPSGRCFLPAAPIATRQIKLIIQAFRQKKHPIIFTQHYHDGPSTLGMFGRFFSDYIKKGEPDANILPELTPAADEIVITKNTYDSFHGTILNNHLKSLNVKQLLITGVLTHMCCETTARSAFCHGFEVYIPVDATATTKENRHLAALIAMADSVARITCTNEVLNCLTHTK